MPECRSVFYATMMLSYSVDQGQQYTVWTEFLLGDYTTEDFVHVLLDLPVEAETSSTRFRWEELDFVDSEVRSRAIRRQRGGNGAERGGSGAAAGRHRGGSGAAAGRQRGGESEEGGSRPFGYIPYTLYIGSQFWFLKRLFIFGCGYHELDFCSYACLGIYGH